MNYEVKVVARTFEVGEEHNTDKMNYDLTLLSGKAAGVCYMPDDYLEEGIQNVDRALKRAAGNSESGHHSVYDHGHITFCVKSNKMMCMILNSLGVYTTSEKSARYTKMEPETQLEMDLYNKWRGIIQQLILKKYPDIDDEMLSKRLCKKLGVDYSRLVINGESSNNADILLELKKSETLQSYKLAQENARYMISVFTPTTMMYTVSFRQVFLIIDYLTQLGLDCENTKYEFSQKLLPHVIALRTAFKDAIGEQRLNDNKNQYIRFLEAQHIEKVISLNGEKTEGFGDIKDIEKPKKEVLGDSYTLVYNGSLAMLAQAQRHRTIRYTMFLRDNAENGFGFYCPEIVEDAGLKAEWDSDIKSVAYCYPQGTLVRITEQGIFEDMALKAKERLCGRAQLEIMISTAANIRKFTSEEAMNNLSYSNKLLLKNMLDSNNNLVPRCKFKDFTCKEGCRWGSKALERLI